MSDTNLDKLNKQILDSIGAMQNIISESKDENIMAIAYQVMAHTAGLAMINAVNQQHQMYILQNAVTTAAANAALESNPEEAVKIINDSWKNNSMLETFNGLKNFIDDLTKTYKDLKTKTSEQTTTKKPEGKSKKENKSQAGTQSKQG